MPGPYRVGAPLGLLSGGPARFRYVFGADCDGAGSEMAVCYRDPADAEFIVLALNAHDDLLAALVRLRDLDVNCSQAEDQAAWRQANAAVAKATQTTAAPPVTP
jgi:hypothetical protein